MKQLIDKTLWRQDDQQGRYQSRWLPEKAGSYSLEVQVYQDEELLAEDHLSIMVNLPGVAGSSRPSGPGAGGGWLHCRGLAQAGPEKMEQPCQ